MRTNVITPLSSLALVAAERDARETLGEPFAAGHVHRRAAVQDEAAPVALAARAPAAWSLVKTMGVGRRPGRHRLRVAQEDERRGRAVTRHLLALDGRPGSMMRVTFGVTKSVPSSTMVQDAGQVWLGVTLFAMVVVPPGQAIGVPPAPPPRPHSGVAGASPARAWVQRTASAASTASSSSRSPHWRAPEPAPAQRSVGLGAPRVTSSRSVQSARVSAPSPFRSPQTASPEAGVPDPRTGEQGGRPRRDVGAWPSSSCPCSAWPPSSHPADRDRAGHAVDGFAVRVERVGHRARRRRGLRHAGVVRGAAVLQRAAADGVGGERPGGAHHRRGEIGAFLERGVAVRVGGGVAAADRRSGSGCRGSPPWRRRPAARARCRSPVVREADGAASATDRSLFRSLPTRYDLAAVPWRTVSRPGRRRTRPVPGTPAWNCG